MKFAGKHIAMSVGALLGVIAIQRAYSVLYASPRDALNTKISRQQEELNRYAGDAAARDEITGRRSEFIATTLGGQVDEVQHEFRTRLTEIARTSGLIEEQIKVSSGNPRLPANPAARRATKSWRDLFRADPDFAVMEGQVRGVGTLDDVLRTVATIQAQSWAHRVDSISLRPSADAETFELRVGVRTVFLPGENPEPLPPVEDLPINGEMAWAGIVAKNVFREPKPTEVVVVALPSSETPIGTLSPPYHEWRMAGVWDGANTLGVILVNTRTGRFRLLAPGDRVLGAKLISAAGERAEFDVDGTRYELLQKQTLAEWRKLH